MYLCVVSREGLKREREREVNFGHGPWLFQRCFSMEILRSEVVVVDVGVRPYSSKMPTTSNPVGPLSDTRIHLAPTLIFSPQQLNSLPPSFLVGATSPTIVKLTLHFHYIINNIPNWLLVSGVPSTFKTKTNPFFSFILFTLFFFNTI